MSNDSEEETMSKNWDLKLEKSGEQGLREERGHRAKVRKTV